MPQPINIQQNQNLLDICLQTTGSLDGLFDLAMANNLSITDELQAGQTIVISGGIATNQDILNYYKQNSVQPATAITNADVLALIDTTQDNSCGEFTCEFTDEFTNCDCDNGFNGMPIVFSNEFSNEFATY